MKKPANPAARLLITPFQRFFALESASGIILVIAAFIALVVNNSAVSQFYTDFLAIPGRVEVGELVVAKPLLLWVNDLWMAVFFLLVGLEIKRELLEGDLSSTDRVMLPLAAALGGMAVPAIIYAVINAGDPVALRGWAIPAATDIAFALGILLLLGSRVPASLKVFLTAVAIIDDLGAIVVIALFYTADLSLTMIGLAGAGLVMLFLLNRMGVMNVGVYIIVGAAIWVCVLKSGVHATLAGVATALAIPMRDAQGESPLKKLEHALHPWVAYVVLPMFAFTNAGVALQGVTLATLAEPIPLGIGLGLLAGKVLGVFGVSFLAIRFGMSSMPKDAGWSQLFGVCVLCGIGFTMSLFIGSLAFGGLDPSYDTQVKIGVLGGSLLSATLGYVILRFIARPRAAAGPKR